MNTYIELKRGGEKVFVNTNTIALIKRVDDATIIEFIDGLLLVVDDPYEEVKKIIEEAKNEELKQ